MLLLLKEELICTYQAVVLNELATVYAYIDPRPCYKNRYPWLNLAVNTFITLSTLLSFEPIHHPRAVENWHKIYKIYPPKYLIEFKTI